MKRIIAVMIVIMLVLTLFGCEEKTQYEKARDRAVEIAKQYLDYEITADEAIDKLKSIAIPKQDDYCYTILSADISALVFYITLSDFEGVNGRIDVMQFDSHLVQVGK